MMKFAYYKEMYKNMYTIEFFPEGNKHLSYFSYWVVFVACFPIPGYLTQHEVKLLTTAPTTQEEWDACLVLAREWIDRVGTPNKPGEVEQMLLGAEEPTAISCEPLYGIGSESAVYEVKKC